MRALGAGYYTPAQVEAAVRYVCVPDPELIEDGTYLVAELDGRLVGCGGWSLRRKAYAGPALAAPAIPRSAGRRRPCPTAPRSRGFTMKNPTD
jgi:hypothetical protein